VQDFVAHDGGGDLASMVNLIDTYGERVVTAAVDACVDEADASLVVSTAHRAKGREWKTVKIAEDFPTPTDGAVGSSGASPAATGSEASTRPR